MAEEWCLLNKDTLVIKPLKKSHLALRMFVLAAVMICGVYICSVCLKQIGSQSMPRFVKFELTEEPCSSVGVPPSEVSYLHYPKPTTYIREECACTPVRKFAILSMQRSGSGWFETLLNSHVNISSNGEIFSIKERRNNMSSIIRTLDKVYNLDWYSSASKNECTAAVGFKWMLNQGLMANHDEIVKYFNERGVYAILLFRRNLLRRLVSQLANDHDRRTKQLNGKHRAHVHSEYEANVLAKYKPTLNATELMSSLKTANECVTNALDYFNSTRHIVLYYEDLILNHTKLVDVLKFLGVPQRLMVSRHVKIHKKPLSKQVENWEDVYNAIKGTEASMGLQDRLEPNSVVGWADKGASFIMILASDSALPPCNQGSQRRQRGRRLSKMVAASGTNSWAKEMVIRRRIANIFNKREDDFPSLKDYNDYLEEVEDMTSNLVEGIDVAAIEAKIAKYQEENAEQIINARARKAEELAAALRASQNPSSVDPADAGPGPSSQGVGVGSQGQYAPAAVPGGLMQPRPTGMAPQPVPVGAPADPLQGYAAEDEETMKLRAERGARAGGWTIELSKRRAIEEAFSGIWV
ncbi:unnamed protein product [Musa banksii]